MYFILYSGPITTTASATTQKNRPPSITITKSESKHLSRPSRTPNSNNSAKTQSARSSRPTSPHTEISMLLPTTSLSNFRKDSVWSTHDLKLTSLSPSNSENQAPSVRSTSPKSTPICSQISTDLVDDCFFIKTELFTTIGNYYIGFNLQIFMNWLISVDFIIFKCSRSSAECSASDPTTDPPVASQFPNIKLQEEAREKDRFRSIAKRKSMMTSCFLPNRRILHRSIRNLMMSPLISSLWSWLSGIK